MIGREVPLKLLRAVWETPGSLDVHLLELKRQEFLFERSTVGDQIYVFKHALTQEVAHESLLTSVKQMLHEATGACIGVALSGPTRRVLRTTRISLFSIDEQT